MGRERRKFHRINVNLPARWEGVSGKGEAKVSSLSFGGCFLLSGAKVDPKELLRIEISIADWEHIYAWGEVVNQAYEIGFAVQFTVIDDRDQVRLAEYILQHT